MVLARAGGGVRQCAEQLLHLLQHRQQDDRVRAGRAQEVCERWKLERDGCGSGGKYNFRQTKSHLRGNLCGGSVVGVEDGLAEPVT